MQINYAAIKTGDQRPGANNFVNKGAQKPAAVTERMSLSAAAT